MGGYSSGRHGGKRTTNDMHVLDIRKIARAELLKPGCSFSWQWTRGGEKIASIGLRTETDRVVLNYRSRANGDEWQDMNYPCTWPGVAATMAGSAPGGFALLWVAGGAWRCCMGARCMRAGTATNWPTKPSGSKPTTGQAAGRTRSANGWAGRQAF